ncbi:MAG: hypothetical protein J6A37_07010 [Oscillospiraceae bacterium]|nr:hypothetical protein [Oscillospiraceae bacterium]
MGLGEVLKNIFSNKEKAIKIMFDNIATVGEDRHVISRRVINNYSDSEDPLNKLACALAYINEGASYRKQAIACMEFYFSHPVELPKQKNNNPYFSMWYLHSELSKLYEKEYLFDKAIAQLELCIECCDEINCADFTRIADILVKKDSVSDALQYLEGIKNMEVYKSIKYAIDCKYNELLDKKAKGYVYNPRKK